MARGSNGVLYAVALPLRLVTITEDPQANDAFVLRPDQVDNTGGVTIPAPKLAGLKEVAGNQLPNLFGERGACA